MNLLLLFIFLPVSAFAATKLQMEMLKALKPVEVVDGAKIRCGSAHDGGYVFVDGFNYDAFYSYGIGDNCDFEVGFLQLPKNHHLISQCYDHSIPSFPSHNQDRICFHHQGISAKPSINIDTLDAHMMSNGDSLVTNAFLKMDIEGAEWSVLFQLDEGTLKRFKQIVIELHGLGDGTFSANMKTKVAVLKRLSNLFHVVHVHGNNYGHTVDIGGIAKVPWVLEVTYLRKSPEIRVASSKTNYPMPGLDSGNKPGQPDIQLDTFPFAPYR